MKHADLIQQRTLEEKASLCSGKDFWQTKNIDRLSIPSMFLSDGPHGVRKQAKAADHLGLNPSIPSTCFPTAATMASSFDPELGEERGKALGEEARAEKVNILLGPGRNIKRNPRCGRNFEYFSEDPYLAGKMAASYARGIESQGVSCCIKHFACNNQETRRRVYDSVVDERTLREIYLTGFEIAIKEGKNSCIRSSYNRLNGTYANENEHLLKDILRNDFSFQGRIVTDWGGDNDRVAGLKAGDALEMPSTDGTTDKEIVEAVKNGTLSESVLDERVDEILTLIDQTKDAVSKDYSYSVEDHHELAQRCFEDSAVLLKNENHILPLKKTDKVAIIGDFAKNPRYQGAGSSIVNPTKLDDLLELKEEYPFEFVGYEQGFDRYGKKKSSLVKKAVALAEKADIVLYTMGLDEVTEAEGLDRKDIQIPQNQLDLLHELKKTGKKIIVLLSCGSVVDRSFESDCDAIRHLYLSGQAGARGILNLLSGKVNPSGKLAETYPRKEEDIPFDDEFPSKSNQVLYKEGLFVGYRYYQSAKVKVRYPFGYGLSYTTFSYSNMKVSEEGVSFRLKNTGNCFGKEVAERYISLPNSKVIRPIHELKGFKKVALNPGEEKEVFIPFDDYTFRFFNVKDNKFETEKGEYVVEIGSSSEDIRLTSRISQDGVVLDDKNPLLNTCYATGKVKEARLDDFFLLLGRTIDVEEDEKKKKHKRVVDYNTTVMDLRYAKGWTGRFFSFAIRTAEKVLRAFGKRQTANTLVRGMFYNPMRGLSRRSGGRISFDELNGLRIRFNGKFFKGLHAYFKAHRRKKKRIKQRKKAEKASA